MTTLQGSTPSLQGGTISLQGGAPKLQGGNITLQGNGTPKGITISVPQPAKQATVAANNAAVAAGGGSGGGAAAQVYAPYLDLNSIYGQAKTNAQNNVNPYYTKQLNDFIAQQATAKQQQQQQTDMNIKNLQDQLAQTQAANALTGTRTTEDTATAEGKIATTADQRQTDQGTAFDTARNAEAANLAQSGLTGSGIAARQEATSQAQHDTTETQQAQADQEAKDSAELAKARTFEDIATSNTNAVSGETKGEKQANFDLDKFIQGQVSDLSNTRNTLENQRLQAVATEQQNQAKLLINNFINKIANPAQRQAALAAYG